jgi:hypothetical protein
MNNMSYDWPQPAKPTDRPTPETDAIQGNGIHQVTDAFDHARKMERQRDDAMAKIVELESKPTDFPASDDAACSGRVEISYKEIDTTGGCCSGMQSVILSIAAAKGCPIDGVIAPKYHPDYNYRVTHYAEGNMSIEWSPRVGQNARAMTPAKD